jgi:cation diffusion facilitator CzcD-associated flavoprotein CzcO
VPIAYVAYYRQGLWRQSRRAQRSTGGIPDGHGATPSAYAYYLGEYAKPNGLPIETHTRVETVRRVNSYFHIETSRAGPLNGGGEEARVFESDLLVNATGYFSCPYTPPYPGLSTTRIAHLHVSGYRDPESIRAFVGSGCRRILIVGKRLSAGESMVELHNAGYQVELSFRGQLKFGPSPALEALLSPLTSVVENARRSASS